MPTYSFQMSARVAGSSVSVTAAGSSTVVASGTLDANSLFTASLPVGDYVATAAGGHYSYKSAGTVAQSDPDQLVDLAATYLGRTAAGAEALFGARAAVLRRFRLALAARDTAPVDIVLLGDSITEGTRALTSGDTFADRFTAALRARFQPVGITGGAGYVPTNATYPAVFPGTWTFPTGTWSPGTSDGLGRYNRTLSTAGNASLPFTGTGVRIFFTAYNGGPILTVKVDGATVGTVSINQATTEYGKFADVTGFADGAHTLDLSITGGTVNLHGVGIFRGDETKGIRVWRAGHSGDQASAALSGVDRGGMVPIKNIAPSLVVVYYGTNEYRGDVTPATFKTSLQAIVTRLRADIEPDPSIVLVAGYKPAHPATPVYPWSQYVAAIDDLVATDGNLAVIHLDNQFSATPSTVGGMDADLVHPSPTGHRMISDALTGFVSPY